MASVAETIVLGTKLYKAGKQIKKSVSSVNKGLKTYEKKQAQQQRKPVNHTTSSVPAKKTVSTPKSAAKPVSKAQVNTKRR